MPPETRLSSAYKDFGRKKSTFASGISALNQLEQEYQFKTKKLGLKGQQKQDFLAHTGQLIGLGSSAASIYGEYQEGQKAMESFGKSEFEQLDVDDYWAAGLDPVGDDGYKSRSWDELQPEEKDLFMPQKDYGFDTTTRWGKWGKTFADISEFTGDWDPTYKIGNKSIKMSHIKSLYDLSQAQDIAQEYGIKFEGYKNVGDGTKSLKSIQKNYSTEADKTVKTETPSEWDLGTDEYLKDLSEKQTMKRWISNLFENLETGTGSELKDTDKIETLSPADINSGVDIPDDLNIENINEDNWMNQGY